MAFKSFIPVALSENWQMTEPRAVLLSGAHGIIARHVRTHLDVADTRWTLTPEELLNLARETEASKRWIVFEQKEDTSIKISRVERVSGISKERTELLVTFSPLEWVGEPRGGIVRCPQAARQWSEGLCLSAGAHRLDGLWQWADLSLNIGAAVIQR